MPHIWIEYSGNLALDSHALMRTVQDAAVGDGSLFPLAGARTRAVRVDDCLIVDGHPDNAFVHVVLRIGHGRSGAQKSALGDRVFQALSAALAPHMAMRPLGISMQIEEADPVLNYKQNNYRDYLAARAAQANAALAGPPRTVVGAALNTHQSLDALGDSVNAPPYKAAPRAPVLYIKPANTYARDGDTITLPADVDEVEVGACLGVVFSRRATRVSEARALDHVAGYRVVADLSVPHASYFRPALKQKCRDGFCPMGDTLTPASAVADPNALDIEVRVDGVVVQRASTADLVRPVARLIADVTQFMSFEAGDMLLVGAPHDAPRVRAGQRYDIRIVQVGMLGNTLAAAAT
ncbi:MULTISPECIES: fumarylacetoacetate hydrolase family protein [Achromobacter]|uniref:Fumarylacetoacetate hydrolase family protein n=1 Tax=Achromobacter spanius TaxID=217203 RepID=A0ABY8GZQ9_9BURK|nr:MULTISPECIES: fumarylacetoacetate hydrolase family protein [Achromobacter]WAI86180.1 fumarylacetoacetate hydrolase family protein [Achromobacter spanius]WEX96260.1 fumarylacetoacetate hydrolase family protein [Achromobacter sp. SS2-2022]WFP10021.1 fumarylacetoacetate hydrolase family protein [Achromobacter spanius]